MKLKTFLGAAALVAALATTAHADHIKVQSQGGSDPAYDPASFIVFRYDNNWNYLGIACAEPDFNSFFMPYIWGYAQPNNLPYVWIGGPIHTRYANDLAEFTAYAMNGADVTVYASGSWGQYYNCNGIKGN